MSLLGLATVIHNHTGAEGKELEALTFYVAAGFADVMSRKDIGDYFDKRCKLAHQEDVKLRNRLNISKGS